MLFSSRGLGTRPVLRLSSRRDRANCFAFGRAGRLGQIDGTDGSSFFGSSSRFAPPLFTLAEGLSEGVGSWPRRCWSSISASGVLTVHAGPTSKCLLKLALEMCCSIVFAMALSWVEMASMASHWLPASSKRSSSLSASRSGRSLKWLLAIKSRAEPSSSGSFLTMASSSPVASVRPKTALSASGLHRVGASIWWHRRGPKALWDTSTFSTLATRASSGGKGTETSWNARSSRGCPLEQFALLRVLASRLSENGPK
mmetsp:Transcript_6270/g.13503  ORF Transcript_6270/g.13503 Transcript_6270/m.13503 type:complete len:256 (+) Transcript_6270:846-1613(+)